MVRVEMAVPVVPIQITVAVVVAVMAWCISSGICRVFI